MADVVRANVPLLIEKKTLLALSGELEFARSIWAVQGNVGNHLAHLQSGNLCLPCKSPISLTQDSVTAKDTPYKLSPVRQDHRPISMSDADILKVHLHVSRCSIRELKELLAGHRAMGEAQLKRVVEGRTCRGVAPLSPRPS